MFSRHCIGVNLSCFVFYSFYSPSSNCIRVTVQCYFISPILQLISVVPFPLSCYIHLRVCSVQCSDYVLHCERVNGELSDKKPEGLVLLRPK